MLRELIREVSPLSFRRQMDTRGSSNCAQDPKARPSQGIRNGDLRLANRAQPAMALDVLIMYIPIGIVLVMHLISEYLYKYVYVRSSCAKIDPRRFLR